MNIERKQVAVLRSEYTELGSRFRTGSFDQVIVLSPVWNQPRLKGFVVLAAEVPVLQSAQHTSGDQGDDCAFACLSHRWRQVQADKFGILKNLAGLQHRERDLDDIPVVASDTDDSVDSLQRNCTAGGR